MKYVLGIVMIAAGFFMVWKTDWFIRMFGSNSWAEAKLGGGGTWTFYKLGGLLFILLAFLIMSGSIFSLLDFIFARG